mmetsp:Transcript_5824/g.12119  ORF Transcript_5824/g.12119 Transcript_5824/m.12119 type:complete len:312 (+) Transcript_5824:257-1192(+)
MNQQETYIQQQVCRDACALNNTAVALMQRGDFEASLRTLKDSIALMEHINADSSSSNTTPVVALKNHAAVSNQGDKYMRLASSRLCQSMVGSPFHQQEPPPMNNACSHISVVESNDTAALHAMARTAASMACANSFLTSAPTAIVIRELNSSTGLFSWERETGILLYNFALAAFFTAHYTTRRPQKKSKLVDVAYRSLLMAHSAFARLLEHHQDQLSFSSSTMASSKNNLHMTHDNTSPEDEIACLEQVIVLHMMQMLTLAGISQILLGQGQVQQAARAHGSIQALQESVQMHHNVMFQVFCDPRNTAPAA